MSRSVWTGAISFGLVAIPVRLFPATRRRDLKFNLLHRRCGSRIQYRRWCPRCEEELSTEEMVRGYEYARGQYVTLEDEEIKNAAGEQTNQIELVSFARLPEIDPVYFDRTYHAVPQRPGRKAYALLSGALQSSERVGIGRFVLRNKPHLVSVRAGEHNLMIETMYYPDEVVEQPEEVQKMQRGAGEGQISTSEWEMAEQLVGNLSEPFQPEQYVNDYRKRLETVIESKIEGRDIVTPPEREVGEVIDLMEALEKSLEATEEQTGGSG